jgi:hypothetical protein
MIRTVHLLPDGIGSAGEVWTDAGIKRGERNGHQSAFYEWCGPSHIIVPTTRTDSGIRNALMDRTTRSVEQPIHTWLVVAYPL